MTGQQPQRRYQNIQTSEAAPPLVRVKDHVTCVDFEGLPLFQKGRVNCVNFGMLSQSGRYNRVRQFCGVTIHA